MIKSFGDLTPSDLSRHPVWIDCHTADEGQTWYDEADEDDYRPHHGEAPTVPYNALYVVQAMATLADGSSLSALLHLLPAAPGSGGQTSADVFGPTGTRVNLQPASMGLSEQVRRENLASLQRQENLVFPMTVASTLPQVPRLRIIDWFTQFSDGPDT